MRTIYTQCNTPVLVSDDVAELIKNCECRNKEAGEGTGEKGDGMSENETNETTNAQGGQQDTAALVMEAIGGIVAKLGVCHDNAKNEEDAWEFRKIRTELAALLPALDHGLRMPAPASDTVSKVVALWDEMTAALRAWYPDSVTHPSNRLADKADALRPELERLLARPTVDSDTAQRVVEIRERYLDVQKRNDNNRFLQSEDRVWALDTIKDLADTVDALLAERDELLAERDALRVILDTSLVCHRPAALDVDALARRLAGKLDWILKGCIPRLWMVPIIRTTLQQALAQQAGEVPKYQR